ncbi:predicted protein [Naegleria gruberi]|uniref:Predicted protein n=1 Tax=Naegleria gruberi TaxID=5762 RepID=D2VLR3_NAEGR|nr:uncharacterized protein NAEGRDRAFT_69871 [Naegleria gruberi]EFC42185.1 predicted protein [Naegleria gruberi]|eukprot:XP_002674929.1 predicted protein [Naegleria gruberi strain NEG-M]
MRRGVEVVDKHKILQVVEDGNVAELLKFDLAPIINDFYFNSYQFKVFSLGKTLLYVACERGHLEIVKLLLTVPNVDVNLGSKVLYKQKKYEYDKLPNSHIIVFKDIINIIAPKFLENVLLNEEFIRSLNNSESEILQLLIDKLIYNPEITFTTIKQKLFVLFILDKVSNEMSKFQNELLESIISMIDMKSVLNIVYTITNYQNRDSDNNNSYLNQIKEYCLDFVAFYSNTPEYDQYFENNDRAIPYFKTLVKRRSYPKINVNMNSVEPLKVSKHPGIVKLIHYEENDNNVQLFLELMKSFKDETNSFNDFGGQGYGQIFQIMFIALKIAQTLEFLHSEKIYHHDLKPSNILYSTITINGIEYVNDVKLTDFSVAKESAKYLTTLTSIYGTAGYMPPEIAEMVTGAEIGNTKVDAFSFGVTLNMLLTNQSIVRTKDSNTQLLKINFVSVEELCKHYPCLTEEQAKLIHTLGSKCVEYNFKSRPEFKEIVNSLLDVVFSLFNSFKTRQ